MTATDLDRAHQWERLVADALRDDGWPNVSTFGQALLPDAVSSALRCCDRWLPVRWLPDLVSVGRRGVIYFDAKGGGDTRYAEWTLALDALEAHVRLADVLAGPIVYVLSDWSFVGARLVNEARQRCELRRGPITGNGSGKPYVLVPRSMCHPWASLKALRQTII